MDIYVLFIRGGPDVYLGTPLWPSWALGLKQGIGLSVTIKNVSYAFFKQRYMTFITVVCTFVNYKNWYIQLWFICLELFG